jgi:GINS complex subunit 1
MQEMDTIYKEMLKNLNDETLDNLDSVVATNFTAYTVCFLRSKRAILGYLYERMQRIKRERWQSGVSMSEKTMENMHQTEKEFLEKYVELLTDYSADIDMDLTSDMQPPKDLFVEVRITKDDNQGFVLEDRTLQIRKNNVYYLKRTDAESLIQRGLAEQINIHK